MATEGTDIPTDLEPIEAALGRMVYRAGNLEAVVRYAGRKLATTEEQRSELDGVSAGTLVDKTRKFAKESAASGQISSSSYSGLAKLLDEVNPHLKSRNAYIHGMWVAQANGQPFVMLSQKNGTVQTRPLASEELAKLSDALLTLSNGIFDWTEQTLPV